MLFDLRRELADRKGLIGSERPHRALDAGSVAVPDLHFAVTRPDKKRIRVLVGRVDHRYRIRFVEPGQEVER